MKRGYIQTHTTRLSKEYESFDLNSNRQQAVLIYPPEMTYYPEIDYRLCFSLYAVYLTFYVPVWFFYVYPTLVHVILNLKGTFLVWDYVIYILH